MIGGALLLGGAALDANQSKVDGGTIRGVVKMLLIGFFIFATLQTVIACVGSVEFDKGKVRKVSLGVDAGGAKSFVRGLQDERR